MCKGISFSSVIFVLKITYLVFESRALSLWQCWERVLCFVLFNYFSLFLLSELLTMLVCVWNFWCRSNTSGMVVTLENSGSLWTSPLDTRLQRFYSSALVYLPRVVGKFIQFMSWCSFFWTFRPQVPVRAQQASVCWFRSGNSCSVLCLNLHILQYLLWNLIFSCNICDLKLDTYYAPFFTLLLSLKRSIFWTKWSEYPDAKKFNQNCFSAI